MSAANYMKLVNGVWYKGATTDDISIGTMQLNTAGTGLTLGAGVNASMGGTLSVTGASTVAAVTASGAVAMNAGGSVASGQTLTVQGATLAMGSGATLSGAATASGAWTFSGAGTALSVTNNASVGGTLGVTGAVAVGSLDVNSGGITEAGAISGVTTLAASGAVTVASLNAGSGLIQTTGNVQANNLIADSLDTAAVSALTIGTTNASGITISKTDVTTTIAGNLGVSGNLTVQGTETVIGGTTFGSQINFGKVAVATSGTTMQNSILAQWKYAYWNGSASVDADGFAIRATPASAAAGVGSMSFLDAGSTERIRFVAGSSKILVNGIDALAAGAFTIGSTTATSVTITPATTITGAATMSSTLGVTGLATFSGGATVAAGQTLTITGATLAAGTGATVTGQLNIQDVTLAAGTGAAFSGAVLAGGAWHFTASGNAIQIDDSLLVSGTATVRDLAASHAVTVGTTLDVTGASTFTGLATFNGGATISTGDTLTVQGATIAAGTGVTFSGTVTASGAWTLSAAGTALTVNNNATITGVATMGTATITGAATVGTTLGVSGLTTATGGVNAVSADIYTTGQVYGAQMSASTGAASPDFQASGWGNITSSATADMNIGTDAAKTRNLIMSSTGKNTTIQGNLIVNGTITGSLSGGGQSVKLPNFTADTGGVISGQMLKISSNDKVAPAQADSIANCLGCVGSADSTAAATAACLVVDRGIVTPVKQTGEPSWTAGDRIYLSASEAGKVTKTAPSAAGNVILRVGFAKNATEMMVSFGDPIVM